MFTGQNFNSKRLTIFRVALLGLISTLCIATANAAQPALTSPTTASQLAGSSVNFEWASNGTDVDYWALWIGSTPGDKDIFKQTIRSTSVTVDELPLGTSTLHVRLYANTSGSWTLVDTDQFDATIVAPPNLVSPSTDSSISEYNQTFQWDDHGFGIEKWALWVGTSEGGKDLHNRTTTGTSAVVSNLPLDGNDIYASLFSFQHGKWNLVDEEQYSTLLTVNPELLTPSSQQILSGDTETFTWTSNGASINKWALWLGTAEGKRDIFHRVVNSSSTTVENLPTNGETLFARLYAFTNGSWSLQDKSVYTAATFTEPENPVVEPPVEINEYNLVFGDEFAGSELDTDKWATSLVWGPYVTINAEEQYYVDIGSADANAAWSPFELDDGILTISAIPTDSLNRPSEQPAQNSDFWSQNPEYQYNENYNASDANYLSGVIASYKTYSFTHGYVESRMKVPAGKGLWSAFWLHTFKYVEDVPEIDIMEHLGEPANTVHQTMHYFDVEDNWRLVSTPTNSVSETDYSQDFHTYSVSWEPTKVDFFVDGELVLSVADSDFTIAKQAMHVIANLAVGGSWPGSPDMNTEFPAELAIDYIRVYQKKPLGVLNNNLLNAEYNLMFNDDFNGSELDQTKWNTSYLWGPYFRINNEEQYYPDLSTQTDIGSNQTIDVSNGTLKLIAQDIALDDLPAQPPINAPYWSGSSYQYNPDYGQSDGWIPKYTSGLITSYDSFKFVHGYAEARMKIPEGAGLWPAFWLLNGYYVGPQPEIDIMEARGGSTHEVHHSYHYFENNGELSSQTKATTHPNSTAKFSDDFHRYGVEWGPGVIKWYLDGEVVHTVTGPEVSLQLAYVIANLAVGGNYVNDVSPEAIPATLEIDYIKVWQRK